jgi:hypothetical protein
MTRDELRAREVRSARSGERCGKFRVRLLSAVSRILNAVANTEMRSTLSCSSRQGLIASSLVFILVFHLYLLCIHTPEILCDRVPSLRSVSTIAYLQWSYKMALTWTVLESWLSSSVAILRSESDARSRPVF